MLLQNDKVGLVDCMMLVLFWCLNLQLPRVDVAAMVNSVGVQDYVNNRIIELLEFDYEQLYYK